MKINSTLLAAALGLASVSLAGATQFLYYTGSTAARDCVFNTLMNGSEVFDATPEFVGAGNASAGSCSFMVFSNTVGGVPTVIKCDWSGSEAGIADVSGSGTELFMDDPGTGSVPALTGTPNAIAAATGLTNTVHTVDVAQADNAVAFSLNPSSTAVENNDNLVIPFVFVKAPNTLADQASFTDITDANFFNLASGGDKLAVFTGNPADTTTYVYLAGRDNFSGTRVNTYDITGYGSGHTAKQIELSGATPNAMVQFKSPPSNTLKFQGNSGQSSGGTLAKSLTDTTTAIDQVNTGTAGFTAVAYLGLSDDATAEGTPINAVRLTYNGQAYSQANVENGAYALWGNEYTEVKSGSAGYITTIVNSIIANLGSNTSTFEIPASAMNVTRSGPTAVPTHK